MPGGAGSIAFIGPGGSEFLVVLLVLLLMFGAKDAPRILRKLYEIINQIRSTADHFKREVMYGDLNRPPYGGSAPAAGDGAGDGDPVPFDDEFPDDGYHDEYPGDDYHDGEPDGAAGDGIAPAPGTEETGGGDVGKV